MNFEWWNILTKKEKIYVLKKVFKYFATFILITSILVSLGLVLKIEDKIFWFSIGFISSAILFVGVGKNE